MTIPDLKFDQLADQLILEEYSMVAKPCFSSIYYEKDKIDILEGDIVECGVYKGGMSLFLTKLFPNKKIWLVDSKGLNHSFNEQVKQNYFANLLNFNKEANYLDNLNNQFTGKIINVDTGGRLIMDVDNHKKVFNIKEVKFLF
jgi:hypothetical protein